MLETFRRSGESFQSIWILCMYIIESELNHISLKCSVKGENIKGTIPILHAIVFRALLLTVFSIFV